MNQLLFGLLDTTISQGNITVSDESVVNNLNDILIKCGTAVGAIIIVIALIKLILATADENAAGKQNASMLVGVGIVFVSITAVLDVLDITTSSTANSVAKNVLTVIGTFLSYAGAVLLLMAIVSLIMSIASEQPEQKMNGVKLLGSSIGLLSIRGFCTAIALYIGQSSPSATAIVGTVVGFIANIVTYIGGGLIIMGVWYTINSVKDENSKDRDVAIRYFMAGIAAISIRVILTTYFGYTNLTESFSL